MKTRMLIWGIAAACSLFSGFNVAYAAGVIIVNRPLPRHIIPPPPVPIPEFLPVKYHRVQIKIENGVATTSIDQVFRNDSNVDVEGTYIFPLPEEAAISDFAMHVDGKRVSGEILDREKAMQVYEEIVRRMEDPGLLEYVGRNMFQARIYPIPKHGEKRVELVYQQALKYDAGVYKYVYPLDTERFSPRPLEEVTISVHVTSAVPIKSLYSPSHEVETKVEQFQASCGYEARDVKPDKDFVLYYTVSEKEVGLNLLCHRKGDEDGYFMMLLAPGMGEHRVIDKDIVFVLDTSGSMSGDKIKQAKDALRFCINSLGKNDNFNVIRFATNVNTYKNTLVSSIDENVKGAIQFVNKFKARGGTNINDALLSALKMFPDSKRPRMIVFLTDGQPTVGETEMDEIVENVSGANEKKVRIFVFGVGNDVNSHLLDKITEDHRGVPEYVRPGENIEVEVSAFYQKISEPILSDINLDFGKIKTKDTYPATLPDIFKGTQLVLVGRYTGGGVTAITLRGNVDGKDKKFVYEDSFPKVTSENDFIPRMWATRKIGYLMSEIRLKGENRELIDEIVKLSKEYGVMTPYTSFLILEQEEDYQRWGIPSSMAPMMKAEGKRYREAMEKEVGKEAVSSAMDIIELKEKTVVVEPTIETVKHVGDKTFYLKDDVWIDSEYKEGTGAKEVKYLSDKYFDILKNEPKLGKYFAVGRNVIIGFKGRVYRVAG